MQCHFCEREAEIAVEKDGIRVGVCKPHFQDKMEDLADSEWLRGIEEDVDLE